MTSRLQVAVVGIAALWACRVALASTALLHVNSEVSPQLSSVQTSAGPTPFSVAPVQPSSSITVVLLMDTLRPDLLDSVKKDLPAFYASLHKHSLRLAILRNGALELAGPFAARARLQRALDEIQPSADQSTPVFPTVLFDALALNATRLGGDWSSVVLIGNFPVLDPPVIEYASAMLDRAFSRARIRLSWLAPSGSSEAWFPLFHATGGTILRGGLDDFSRGLDEPLQAFFEVNWTSAAPAAGFVVGRSLVSDSQGHVLLEAPDITAPDDASFPSSERYSAMLGKVAEANSLLNQEPVTEGGAQHIREDLEAALAVNPRDPGALVAAATFYEKFKDYVTAATLRSFLVEVHPLDAGAYAALGHALLLGSELDKAEAALKHAVALSPLTPGVAEDFARICLARKDDRGALPYLDQALRAENKRQDLWFLQARTAERLRDSSLAIHSYEQALALGGDHVVESGSLIRLYLAVREDAKAVDLARRVSTNLPPDAALRAQFAGTLDDLHQTQEALAAWRRVLEVQPNFERAHYRISCLLLELGDGRAAEQAANAGLAVAPKFAALYLAKADALEKQGRIYGARNALREGAAVVADAAVLDRLAAAEDTYGGLAADVYARLADSLGASSTKRLPALERGFAVSLRDGDFQHAQSFAALLESAGHPEFRSLIGTGERAESGAIIPGGLEALAFVAHAKERVPPERFFAEYSRKLVDEVCLRPSCGNSSQYVGAIQEHFQRIAELEALGKREGNRVVITLSVDGKKSRQNTEKVLSLLGIKLRSSKGGVELNRGEKKAQVKKQETASALSIDEVGIQEALQARKPYTFEIPYEWAAIYPSEKLWRDAFYAKDEAPGGFALALARIPKMARLYAGLSSLDKKTIAELLTSVSLKSINDRYAEMLYGFAPAFALQGGHAAVPGGAQAEAIWAHLVGAGPDQPGAFFRALLEREDGRLLAFFFALSQLDRRRQQFFTANPSRTAQFYKLFAESEEMRHGPKALGYDSSFAEVLRSVPLNAEGRVAFPGSPEVWMVASGRSASDSKTAKLAKLGSRSAAPDTEDAILLRLARTRYADRTARHTELDNFLSVSRIDAHRIQPLDQESALLLAQRYSASAAAYAYFSDLTVLSADDFRQFFAALDRIKSHSRFETNLGLGQFHSLMEWICLLKRRQVLHDSEAAKLFRYVCDRFASADDGAAHTAASLDSVRAILGYCKPLEGAPSADEQIRSCLLGSPGQPGHRRVIEYQQVMELQKAPSLDALFSIYDATGKNSAASGAALSAIEKAAASLPSVPLPKRTKVAGKDKENVARYDPSGIRKLAAELAQKTSRHNANSKDVAKVARELLAELEPQITAALAGPIYAYFLRPSDLIVSEDPLLLRKHHYLDFDAQSHDTEAVLESEFHVTSEGLGSYFAGGFAQFALAAGAAAGTGWKMGGPAGKEAIAAQIAAIRGANWGQLEESDQRLVSLRILAAREWIFESAARRAEFDALSEETIGLLSLSRRADLLNGVQSRNWAKVWDAVTLPDLFALGGRYLDRFKTDSWSSPVTAALRSIAATSDASRLDVLGAVTYHAFGCGHPHLLRDAPYEEYERHMFPTEMAERAAEFKLFLVFQADTLGVEPPALAGVAEVLAAKAFRNAQMTDFRDWRALLAAYASITPNDLKQALEQ